MKKLIILAFIAVAASYCLSLKYSENLFCEYDSLEHFLGGIFAGSIGMFFWNCLNRLLKISSGKALKALLISYAGFFAFAAGALWEIAQSYKIISGYGPVSDTILDLIMDVLGGILIGFWYIAKREEMFSRFIAVVEKMLANIKFLNHLYLKAYEGLVEKEIEMASISKKDKVVHIGCGAVPYTSRLIAEKTGANVVGIDNDSRAISLATEYINSKADLTRKLTLKLVDARDFSISDFDVVIVSHTVEPQKEILENIISSMKQGARLIYRKRKFVFVRKSMCIKSTLIKKESS